MLAVAVAIAEVAVPCYTVVFPGVEPQAEVVSASRKEKFVFAPTSFQELSMAGEVCDQCQMSVLLCGSQIYILAEIIFFQPLPGVVG